MPNFSISNDTAKKKSPSFIVIENNSFTINSFYLLETYFSKGLILQINFGVLRAYLFSRMLKFTWTNFRGNQMHISCFPWVNRGER